MGNPPPSKSSRSPAPPVPKEAPQRRSRFGLSSRRLLALPALPAVPASPTPAQPKPYRTQQYTVLWCHRPTTHQRKHVRDARQNHWHDLTITNTMGILQWVLVQVGNNLPPLLQSFLNPWHPHQTHQMDLWHSDWHSVRGSGTSRQSCQLIQQRRVCIQDRSLLCACVCVPRPPGCVVAATPQTWRSDP